MINIRENDLGCEGVWKHYCPTQVHFGPGSLTLAGRIVKEFGNKALIVASPSALKLGYVDEIINSCHKQDVETQKWESPSGEPNSLSVNDLALHIEKISYTSIIAIGGGSIIDLAKSASSIAHSGKKAEYFINGPKIDKKRTLPLIAIPTTAGTGSELSQGAIVTDSIKNVKGGIRGIGIFPTCAVVDPALTLTLDEKQIKITGFDVFSHAVETFISKASTPITRESSLSAISTVVRQLPKALNNRKDLGARVSLSYSSMMMGSNLANSSTCLPHRMQYPIGTLTNTEHALGVASLYPAWVDETYEDSALKFDQIAECIADQRLDSNKDIRTQIERFMSDIGLVVRLSDLGVDRSMCSTMSGMVSGNLGLDPWWNNQRDTKSIYLKAL